MLLFDPMEVTQAIMIAKPGKITTEATLYKLIVSYLEWRNHRQNFLGIKKQKTWFQNINSGSEKTIPQYNTATE